MLTARPNSPAARRVLWRASLLRFQSRVVRAHISSARLAWTLPQDLPCAIWFQQRHVAVHGIPGRMKGWAFERKWQRGAKLERA